jgi:hypothetical protein
VKQNRGWKAPVIQPEVYFASLDVGGKDVFMARIFAHLPVGGPHDLKTRSMGCGYGVVKSALYFNNVDVEDCPVRNSLTSIPKLSLQEDIDMLAEGYFLNVVSSGPCAERIELLRCYDTYTLHRPAFEPVRLLHCLPTKRHNPSHSVPEMQRCSSRMMANPHLPVSVWLHSGPNAPLKSGEIIFICTAAVFREPLPLPSQNPYLSVETIELVYIRLHAACAVSPTLKPSRSDLRVEADPAYALHCGSSSISGGNGFHLPVDSWHPDIHADAVFLTDDTIMVPITRVVAIADTFPLIDVDGMPECKGMRKDEVRPPLLRTYFRV